jgi:bifunctional non-homologous end joining protein LigD
MPSKKNPPEIITVAGHEVAVSNPGKVLFPDAKYTKLDVVRYYLAVADGALRGAGGRPNMLVRYPNGIAGEHFYQKRAPESRPDWVEVVTLHFPSGREAEEVVPRDAAPPSSSGRRPRTSRRAESRSGSRPRCRVGSGTRCGARCPDNPR